MIKKLNSTIVLTFAYQNLEKVNKCYFYKMVYHCTFFINNLFILYHRSFSRRSGHFSSKKKKKDDNCEEQTETKTDNTENSE